MERIRRTSQNARAARNAQIRKFARIVKAASPEQLATIRKVLDLVSRGRQ